jgi:hypothetical protein
MVGNVSGHPPTHVSSYETAEPTHIGTIVSILPLRAKAPRMQKYSIGARIVDFPIRGHLPRKLGSQDGILQPVAHLRQSSNTATHMILPQIAPPVRQESLNVDVGKA